MKKILKMWWMVVACVAMTLTMVNMSFGASGTFTGPNVIRSGDTIKIVATIDVPGVLGMEATVNYDSSVVTLISVQAVMPGWMAELNGNAMVVYDNELTNPTTGTSQLVTLEFDVKDGVAAGTAINISLSGIVLSDGTNETPLSDIVYTNSVAKPLSKNNKLTSLSVAEGSLSPEFKTTVTSYNVGEVPYSVSALTISTVTEDENAKVSIKGNNLKVGSNLITITVTSESGAQRVYTISVKRKQDPNYVAGADASLKDIKLSVGILSPTFSSDITDYVVYLPYEITSITATGTAKDSKALGVTNGAVDKLVVGDNKMTVVCKAEDGTEKVYTIKVVRMPEYSEDTEQEQTTTIQQETTTELTTTTTDVTVDVSGNTTDKNSDGENDFSIIWYILCIIIGAGIGFGLCYFFFVRRYVEYVEEYEDDENGVSDLEDTDDIEDVNNEGEETEEENGETKDSTVEVEE